MIIGCVGFGLNIISVIFLHGEISQTAPHMFKFSDQLLGLEHDHGDGHGHSHEHSLEAGGTNVSEHDSLISQKVRSCFRHPDVRPLAVDKISILPTNTTRMILPAIPARVPSTWL